MVVLTALGRLRRSSSEGRLRESAKMAPAVMPSTMMTSSRTTTAVIFSQRSLRFFLAVVFCRRARPCLGMSSARARYRV
jgi:hypothetical protein